MGSLKIEYLKLEEIRGWSRNPKDHDLGEIHKAINRFGFVNPLLLDERTGRLVAGHGRVEVLRQMKAAGQSPPERIIEDGGSWLVPVARGVQFNSDVEAEGYLIADNRLTEIGGWKKDELVTVLSDLAAFGSEALDGIGYSGDDLDAMIKDLAPKALGGSEGGPAGEDDLGHGWQVIVTLASEEAQIEFIERMQKEGLECRALII
jgi:hypothetical protein